MFAPLARLLAARWLGLATLPAGVVAPEAAEVVVPPKMPKPIVLPKAVEQWCQGWSDDTAREEARQGARELFASTGSWDKVLVELERH